MISCEEQHHFILWRVQRVLCSFVCSRKGKAEEKGRRMGEKQQAPLAIVILMILMLSSYYGIYKLCYVFKKDKLALSYLLRQQKGLVLIPSHASHQIIDRIFCVFFYCSWQE